MGLLNLFSSNVEIHYKNTFLSKATLFTVVTTLCMLLFPMIIAYRSRGFWLKNYTFYEQPDIRFRYEYLLIIETDDIEITVTCGNLKNFQRLIDTTEHCINFKMKETDFNNDQKTDEITFDFEINVPENHQVVAASLLLVSDLNLHSTCPLLMESLVYINADFSMPASGITFISDLVLHQVSPLPCIGNSRDVRYNISITDLETQHQGGEWLYAVLNNYFGREVSTKLINSYTRKKYGMESTFDINVRIRIPEYGVYYKPSFWHEVKWVLPQYLSLLLIFYWFISKIKMYVFSNRILMTWRVDPIKNINKLK